MEVILLSNIKGLGQLGEVVHVKPGYARNYLIPQKKASYATPDNLAEFERLRAELEAKEQQEIQAAQDLHARLDDRNVQVFVNLRSTGEVYGSVGSAEIVEAIQKSMQIELSKQQVLLPHGLLRQTGMHDVSIRLHTDVAAHIHVEVVGQE